MKHYEVNFIDRTVETVMSSDPPEVATSQYWYVTLLKLDGETESKFVPHGKILINLNNVTYIKET